MGWITLKDNDGVFHHVLLGDEDASANTTGFAAPAGPQAKRSDQAGNRQKLDKPRDESERRLANVIYNETASLRPDPKAKPGQPGSAEDLQNARVAIGEVANRVTEAGNPGRVAPQVLSPNQVKAINEGYPPAVGAYNASLEAARAALAGSNTTSGATQYRLPLVDHHVSEINKRPIIRHYGPFPDTVKLPGASKPKPRRIVFAP